MPTIGDGRLHRPPPKSSFGAGWIVGGVILLAVAVILIYFGLQPPAPS